MHKDVRYRWRITDRLVLIRQPHTVARRFGSEVCRVGHNVADSYSFGRLSIVRVRNESLM